MMPDFPGRLQTIEELNRVLFYASVQASASDVILTSGEPVWVSASGRKVQISERRIKHSEIISLLQQREIYGSNAQALLAGAKPINAAYAFVDQNRSNHRYRLNAVQCLRGGRRGCTVTLRTIDAIPPTLEAVGATPRLAELTEGISQGLILVCGGTGEGKSSLMAALIRYIIEQPKAHRIVVTIEEPIEYVFDEVARPSSVVTQMQVGIDIESFEAGVVNALRMAPDILLIGEARDREMIEAMLQAAQTGHTVFATVHANSVAETVHRLLSAYPDAARRSARHNILQTLRLVIAQRLVRDNRGKRTAVREHLLFRRTLRHKLIDAGERLPSAIYEAMDSGTEEDALTLSAHAHSLHQQGRISDAVCEGILFEADSLKAALSSEG